MKPKYDDGRITIYQGDCLKALKAIGTVDHVITDPPYSERVHVGSRRPKEGQKRSSKPGVQKRELGFDHLTFRTQKRIAQWCGKNVRRWVLCFTDLEGSARWAHEFMTAELDHIRVGIWLKPNASPQFTGDRPGVGFEGIEIAHPKGAKRWNGGGKHGVWTHNVAPSSKDRHPTEKPKELMQELILDFTDPGDVILDPFMGSGATLRAAKELGRRAIGIELDPKWVKVAIDRIAQGVLFRDTAERQASMNLPEVSSATGRSDS